MTNRRQKKAGRTTAIDRWTCAPCAKVGHPNRAQAKRALVAMRALGQDEQGTLSVYQCSATQAWHVGNLNPHLQGHDLNDPRVRFVDDRTGGAT